MFYQSSLLIMLLLPVFTYVAGAMAFSVFQLVRKKSSVTQYFNIIYRNGL